MRYHADDDRRIVILAAVQIDHDSDDARVARHLGIVAAVVGARDEPAALRARIAAGVDEPASGAGVVVLGTTRGAIRIAHHTVKLIVVDDAATRARDGKSRDGSHFKEKTNRATRRLSIDHAAS